MVNSLEFISLAEFLTHESVHTWSMQRLPGIGIIATYSAKVENNKFVFFLACDP